jgi:hypothetical protein
MGDHVIHHPVAEAPERIPIGRVEGLIAHAVV